MYQLLFLSAVKADFTKDFLPLANDHFMPGADDLHHISQLPVRNLRVIVLYNTAAGLCQPDFCPVF